MKKYIPKVILVFLFLQPFLDIFAGIFSIIGIPNVIGISFRFFAFVLCSYYLFFIEKSNRDKNRIYISILFLYLFVFFLHIVITKDIDVLLYEAQNTFNAFYFPVVFIALYQCINTYNIKIKAKHLAILFMVYTTFVFIPTITHTNLASYAISKTGSTGWFNSANSISSILSLLLPFTLIYIKNNKPNYLILSITICVVLYVLFSLGTKVPILCFVIIIGCNLLYYLIYLYKQKRKKQITSILAIFLLTIIASIIIIPKTSFYKNIQIHMNYLKIDTPFEVLKDPFLLDHFVFSQRLTFLSRTHTNYMQDSTLSKIIGIGYIENYGTDEINLKTVEMDYFDIFYRHGIIGFIIYFIPIFFYFKKKHKKIRDNYTRLNIKIPIILIFVLAFFSGHIFVAPATSIIVILIMILYDQANLEET